MRSSPLDLSIAQSKLSGAATGRLSICHPLTGPSAIYIPSGRKTFTRDNHIIKEKHISLWALNGGSVGHGQNQLIILAISMQNEQQGSDSITGPILSWEWRGNGGELLTPGNTPSSPHSALLAGQGSPMSLLAWQNEPLRAHSLVLSILPGNVRGELLVSSLLASDFSNEISI